MIRRGKKKKKKQDTDKIQQSNWLEQNGYLQISNSFRKQNDLLLHNSLKRQAGNLKTTAPLFNLHTEETQPKTQLQCVTLDGI